MIIDSHVHLPTENFPLKGWWDSYIRDSAKLSGRTLERIKERTWDILLDAKGEKLIEDMDEAGIDRSVIIGIDMGLSPYIAEESHYIVEEYNRSIAEVAQANPSRLSAVAGIDPRRGEEGIALFEKCVKEWDMVGLKLHPVFGYYPNERFCYPFYEKALELEVPVFIHTGPEPAVPSKYGQPIHIEEVALDFPDLNIVMIHSGFIPWVWEAIGIASFRPNIFLDVTEWQGVRRSFSSEFYHILAMMLNFVGSSRILFGSDWPFTKYILSQSAWIDTFKELAGSELLGRQIIEDDVAAILGKNIARLLRLDDC